LEPVIFGVRAKKLASAVGAVALMFRVPSADPPFTVTLVPEPTEQVGHEKVIVLPEGVPTMGEVTAKLMIPELGVTGLEAKSIPEIPASAVNAVHVPLWHHVSLPS
jgi:hypothetical protein